MLFDFLLIEKIYQSNCIMFCVKNANKFARTFEILTMAFGESTLSRTQVQLRYNWFKEGREYINDDTPPIRPSTSVKIVPKLLKFK